MKEKISDIIHLIKSYIIVWFNWLLIKLGYKHNETVVPEGPYCYVPDIEKNELERSKENYGVYYVKPCKYFVKASRNISGCKLLGYIGDDFLLNDQCKLCSINDDYKD